MTSTEGSGSNPSIWAFLVALSLLAGLLATGCVPSRRGGDDDDPLSCRPSDFSGLSTAYGEAILNISRGGTNEGGED